MTASTTLRRVFVSSTQEDLEEYRDAVARIALKTGFHPELSENWPAAGDLAPLEKCLEVVSDCALVVVLVAHRYGWVPGDQGEEHASITWLECERAMNEGKEVLAFVISDEAAWPHEQYEDHQLVQAVMNGAAPEAVARIKASVEGLSRFKSWLRGGGITSSFTAAEDLQLAVGTALSAWRSRHSGARGDDEEEAAADPTRALTSLWTSSRHIDIRGLQVGSGKAYHFPIEDLYIPLTSRDRQGLEDSGESTREDEAGETRSGGLVAALASPRLVIIGDPGAGKTTFLRRITHALAETLLGHDPRAAEERLGMKGTAPFPVFVRLAELGEFIDRESRSGTNAPTQKDSPEWLLLFLARASEENSWELTEHFYRSRFKRGEVMVLLDGLDEAASLPMREQLTSFVVRLAQTYADCHVVVTCRPKAYTEKVRLSTFKEVWVAPLDEPAIEVFLGHWCRALFPESEDLARSHRVELDRALDVRADIRRMATNPVMLTALAVVHWNEKRLPEQRADLYRSILVWLSRSREARPDRPQAERCVDLLQEVALQMQVDPNGRRTEVPRRWAAEKLIEAGFWSEGPTALVEAQRFLADEELDSGIIVSRGPNLRFWHLSFQEYLSAKAIAARPDEEQHELVFGDRERLLSPEWRETVLLFAGVLHAQGAARVDALIAAIMAREEADASLREQARIAGLLGSIQRDLSALDYQIREQRYLVVLNHVQDVFVTGQAESMPLELRIEAADALGQAGDPRLREDPWVRIPHDAYLHGAQAEDPRCDGYDGMALPNEGPPRTVDLAAFEVARFPLSVGEYATFVDEGGYLEERYWKGGGFGRWKRPAQWDNQVDHPNHPVVGVSWYEAQAYCLWHGRGVRLPSESEWEAAARGLAHRRFPWGDELPGPALVNFSAAKAGAATPVGLFPRGSTPEGVADLAGNVFEWCCDRYEPLEAEEAPDPDDLSYVVKGGAFDSPVLFIRAAFHGRYRASFRGPSVGFRLSR